MARSASTEITVVPVRGEADLFQALAIREVVFIEEQRVPEGIERDAFDAVALHLLAHQGGHAVGTGRLVTLPQPPAGEAGLWVQISRMAVLQSHRKHGVGKVLLEKLEAEAERRGAAGIMLHAQLIAIEFYKRFNYHPVGAVFEEAGMPHLEMLKRLENK